MDQRKTIFRPFLVFFTIAAILLPVLGPFFDHHFVERMGVHMHIYLGETKPDHIHPFEVAHHDGAGLETKPHVHATPGPPVPNGPPHDHHELEVTGKQFDDDILFLYQDDATTSSVLDNIIVHQLEAPSRPEFGLLRAVPDALFSTVEAFILVPHPPPQA